MRHNICGECWFTVEHDWGMELSQDGEVFGRYPMRVIDSDEVMCCFCGRPTKAGIFIRTAGMNCAHD